MKPVRRLVGDKISNAPRERTRSLLVKAMISVACLSASACGASNTLDLAPVSTTASRAPTSANLQGRIRGSELIASTVQGMNRVCSYRAGPVGSAVRSYRIGFSDRCPSHYPSSDPNFPMPPTARLQESATELGERNCVYVEGSGRWTVTLRLTQTCPLSAGLAAQLQTTPEEDQRRQPPASIAPTSEPDTQVPDEDQQQPTPQ